MTTFYICRHGETENNKAGRLSGWIDTPLTEQGIRNAMSSASKVNGINIDIICSSDLGRAFTTAYIIAQKLGRHDNIQRFKGLREVNYGELANKTFDDYPTLSISENASFIPKGGESLQQMQERVLQCVHQLASENPDKTILLVGHDGTVNAIRASYLDQDIGEADTVHNAHDFVGKFTVDDGKILSFEEVQ